MLELVLDIGADALRDTLYLVPFLLVTYLLLETLEHKAGAHTERLVQKAGHFGPAVAAVLGAVPQCGFSAAGAALFSSRAITLGTLFAVFLSTSDEMLPLFIAEQVDGAVMLQIIGAKVVIGMIMGFAIDGACACTPRSKMPPISMNWSTNIPATASMSTKKSTCSGPIIATTPNVIALMDTATGRAL